MKKLSIIIPHYNDYELLGHLIDSIPTDDTIEIIVVDDKSENQERLADVKGKYDRVIFVDNNSGTKGPGTCRNLGMAISTGDWIMFADSDDVFIERFFDHLKIYFDSTYDIVYFPPTSRYLNSDTESDRHMNLKKMCLDFAKQPNIRNELKLKYSFIVAYSKLFRRSLITDNMIYFDEQSMSEDVMFSVKTAYHSREINASTEEIYCIIKRAGSITSKNEEQKLNIMLETFIRKNKFLRERLSSEDYEKLGYSGFTFIMKGSKFGLKRTVAIIDLLIRNRIRLIRLKNLNPAYWAMKIYHLMLFRLINPETPEIK